MSKVCDLTLPDNCNECYELSLSDDSLNIPANLAFPNTYYLFVIDKFGNIYRHSFAVNADGSFDIDVSEFPADFFNPHAGKFEIFVASDLLGVTKIGMTFSAITYFCIILEITNC